MEVVNQDTGGTKHNLCCKKACPQSSAPRSVAHQLPVTGSRSSWLAGSWIRPWSNDDL